MGKWYSRSKFIPGFHLIAELGQGVVLGIRSGFKTYGICQDWFAEKMPNWPRTAKTLGAAVGSVLGFWRGSGELIKGALKAAFIGNLAFIRKPLNFIFQIGAENSSEFNERKVRQLVEEKSKLIEALKNPSTIGDEDLKNKTERLKEITKKIQKIVANQIGELTSLSDRGKLPADCNVNFFRVHNLNSAVEKARGLSDDKFSKMLESSGIPKLVKKSMSGQLSDKDTRRASKKTEKLLEKLSDELGLRGANKLQKITPEFLDMIRNAAFSPNISTSQLKGYIINTILEAKFTHIGASPNDAQVSDLRFSGDLIHCLDQTKAATAQEIRNVITNVVHPQAMQPQYDPNSAAPVVNAQSPQQPAVGIAPTYPIQQPRAVNTLAAINHITTINPRQWDNSIIAGLGNMSPEDTTAFCQVLAEHTRNWTEHNKTVLTEGLSEKLPGLIPDFFDQAAISPPQQPQRAIEMDHKYPIQHPQSAIEIEPLPESRNYDSLVVAANHITSVNPTHWDHDIIRGLSALDGAHAGLFREELNARTYDWGQDVKNILSQGLTDNKLQELDPFQQPQPQISIDPNQAAQIASSIANTSLSDFDRNYLSNMSQPDRKAFAQQLLSQTSKWHISQKASLTDGLIAYGLNDLATEFQQIRIAQRTSAPGSLTPAAASVPPSPVTQPPPQSPAKSGPTSPSDSMLFVGSRD